MNYFYLQKSNFLQFYAKNNSSVHCKDEFGNPSSTEYQGILSMPPPGPNEPGKLLFFWFDHRFTMISLLFFSPFTLIEALLICEQGWD